jgi:hypothetical protein
MEAQSTQRKPLCLGALVRKSEPYDLTYLRRRFIWRVRFDLRRGNPDYAGLGKRCIPLEGHAPAWPSTWERGHPARTGDAGARPNGNLDSVTSNDEPP